MTTRFSFLSILLASVLLAGPVQAQNRPSYEVRVTDANGAPSIALGRHLVQVTGCNDCHTSGYGASNGHVSESQWLTGDSLGWSGPWGTTYAANLRLYFARISAAQWKEFARHGEPRPPMPWFNLREMSDKELMSIYLYIRSAGPAGSPAPAALPPGQRPSSPVIQFPQ